MDDITWYLWANRTGAQMSEPSQTAKANRERLFAERSAILQAEEKKAVAVRQNMARLRELRLAKEALDIGTDIPTDNQLPKPKSRAPRRSK